MFEQLIESTEIIAFGQRPFSFLLAVILHATAVGGLILVTPLFPESLPNQLRTLLTLYAPPPLPPKAQRAELMRNSVGQPYLPGEILLPTSGEADSNSGACIVGGSDCARWKQ